jgi:hypothetical protein
VTGEEGQRQIERDGGRGMEVCKRDELEVEWDAMAWKSNTNEERKRDKGRVRILTEH